MGDASAAPTGMRISFLVVLEAVSLLFLLLSLTQPLLPAGVEPVTGEVLSFTTDSGRANRQQFLRVNV